MLIKRQDLKLLDKVVLGRAVFQPPFKASSPIHNEARFVHIIKGNTRLYAPKEQANLVSGNSMVMKCENFVNNWLENEDQGPSEVMVVHFYPDVLKFVYDDKLPEVLTSKDYPKANSLEKIELNEMIQNYVTSLRYYFDNPSLITDDLIKIKVQELILVLVSSDGAGRIKSILSELFQTTEYEFQEIIHANLFEDLSIQDLAFFAGMSLSSFKRKFKTVYNTSPTQYIKTKRLEKAKNLGSSLFLVGKGITCSDGIECNI